MLQFLILFLVFLQHSTALHKWNDTIYEIPQLFELDSYERCLKTSGIYCLVHFELFAGPNDDRMSFIHEYSAVKNKHFNRTVIDRGICVTKTCKRYLKNKDISKQADLEAVLEACQNTTVWSEYGLQTRVLEVSYCKTRDIQPQVDAWDWIMATVAIAIVMINIVGSLYDSARKRSIQKNGKYLDNGYLLCFSISRNWLELVTIKKLDKKYQPLTSTNFIRFVTSTFFIFGHVIIFLSGSYLYNTFDRELEYEYTLYYMIFNGMIHVQVFFVMTAVLQYFSMEEQFKKQLNRGTLLFNFIVNRLGRLTPVYVVVMLSCCSWMRFLRSGPLWHEQDLITSQCRKYWWLHLLYLNNFVKEDTICCIHTWYLAVEFQLFLLGSILYVATLHRPGLRNCILVVFLLISVGITTIQTYQQDLDPVVIMNPEVIRTSFKKSNFFHDFYVRTHNNLPCYVIGFLLGHFIYKWNEEKVKLQFKIFYLDWLLLVALPVFYMTSGPMFYAEEGPASLWLRLVYGASHKFVIAGVTGLALISAFFGPDERFRKFMTWDGLVLPARLSYCVYLVHMLVIHVVANARTQLSHYSLFDMFMTFVGVTFVSYLISLPLHLLVELPFKNAVKLWTSKTTDGKKKKF